MNLSLTQLTQIVQLCACQKRKELRTQIHLDNASKNWENEAQNETVYKENKIK